MIPSSQTMETAKKYLLLLCLQFMHLQIGIQILGFMPLEARKQEPDFTESGYQNFFLK